VGLPQGLHLPGGQLAGLARPEKELQEHANPFALFVLAHLQSLATRDDEEQRATWKLRLAQNFIARSLEAADLRQWLRLLDWLLDLPPERNRIVWVEIHKSMKEVTVPFIDYFQQREIDQKRSGEIKGLISGITSVLRLRFGEAGLALLPQLEKQTDPDRLQLFLSSAESAADLHELRKQLP
jgi:hypothetical protein